MTDDRAGTVRSVYDAFAKGDMEALATLLADTEWYEAEGMPYGGHYRGFQKIAANVFGPIAGDVENFTARPDEILPLGEDRAIAFGTYRGQGSAGEVAAPFAHVWTVRDGKIARFVQYADSHLYRQATGL
ncbi:MAG: nuclear transport factor 2 family protein [Parasphingopyxis sp.]|nr:nuclear transport factor 2 family protein [Sphingomonadales bacterium]